MVLVLEFGGNSNFSVMYGSDNTFFINLSKYSGSSAFISSILFIHECNYKFHKYCDSVFLQWITVVITNFTKIAILYFYCDLQL